MGWNKDHGTAAKVNADYAKAQGDVAKQEATNLAQLKTDVEVATQNASTAADNANVAKADADNATSEAITQANHAKNEGDRAKAEADRLAGTDVSVLDNKIGSLSSLNTTNKTSVVESVNEVTTQLAQIASSLSLNIVRATKAASQSIPNNIFTKLTFETAPLDTNALYNNAIPSRVTCKKSGVYMINTQVDFYNNANGVRYVEVKVNGVNVITSSQIAALNGGNTITNLATIYHLNQGDYVEISVLQTSGVAISVTSNPGLGGTYLTMVKVG